jgi:hypothetical protein
MIVSDTLLAAAEVINTDGLRGGPGHDPDGKVCALQAIAKVLGDPCCADFSYAVTALAAAIPVGQISRDEFTPERQVLCYSNTHGQETVLAWFIRAAVQAGDKELELVAAPGGLLV